MVASALLLERVEMNWIALTESQVLADFPTDLQPLYDQWIVDYPAKAGRLAEIVGRVVSEFRDSIASNPVNVFDEDETKIPESCLRHAETMVFYGLMMEMGLSIQEEAQESMTRADIFLRQIGYGNFTTRGENAAAPSPHYNPEPEHPIPLLPLLAALLLLLAAPPARAAWVDQGRTISDKQVFPVFVPSGYTVASSDLYGHLHGIDQVLFSVASTSFVQAAIDAFVASHEEGFVLKTGDFMTGLLEISAEETGLRTEMAQINSISSHGPGKCSLYLSAQNASVNYAGGDVIIAAGAGRGVPPFGKPPGEIHLLSSVNAFTNSITNVASLASAAISLGTNAPLSDWSELPPSTNETDPVWSAQSTNYLPLVGGTLTGPITNMSTLYFYNSAEAEFIGLRVGSAQTDGDLIVHESELLDVKTGNIYMERITNALALASTLYPIPYAAGITLSPTNGVEQSLFLAGPVTNMALVAAGTNDARRIMLYLWSGTNTVVWSATNISGLADISLSATNVNTLLFLSPPLTDSWRVRQ